MSFGSYADSSLVYDALALAYSRAVLVAAGSLYGLTVATLGLWAVLLAVLPYGFTHVAFGRLATASATHRQTIRALGRVPEAGGFSLPGGIEIALSHGTVVVIQLLTFLAKVLFMSSFQILVRWSLPRFRYDQLLRFAWKFLFPICLANLLVTAVAVWALGGFQ